VTLILDSSPLISIEQSAAREIRDEVGIPLEELLPPKIIGAVWNEVLDFDSSD